IQKVVLGILDKSVGQTPQRTDPDLHGIAEREEDRILAWIQDARGPARSRLHDITDSLERAERERHDIVRQIDQAPADDAIRDDAIRDDVQSLRESAQEHGRCVETLREIDNQLAEAEREFEAARRTLARLTEEVARRSDTRARFDLVAKTMRAAREYGENLTQA